MASINLKRITITTAIAAAGLAWLIYERHEQPKRDARLQASIQQRAEARARKLETSSIQARSMPYKGGTITEVKIPTDPFNIGMIEYRTCFVLDSGPPTSPSISCPGEQVTDFAWDDVNGSSR